MLFYLKGPIRKSFGRYWNEGGAKLKVHRFSILSPEKEWKIGRTLSVATPSNDLEFFTPLTL